MMLLPQAFSIYSVDKHTHKTNTRYALGYCCDMGYHTFGKWECQCMMHGSNQRVVLNEKLEMEIKIQQ